MYSQVFMEVDMSHETDPQEQSICSMYQDGVSLRTLRIAFGTEDEEIIRVLHRNGVIEPREGESWEEFVARIRDDVKHAA